MKDKFLLADGMPDINAIEEWAEGYYHGLIGMVNGFYAHADMNDVLASMEAIPFEEFVANELNGASEAVITIAKALVKEIANREIEYIRSYLDL